MPEVPLRRFCRRAPFLALGLALAACGTINLAGANREASQQAAAAFADCNNQLATGRLRSHREAVTCAEPRVLTAYQTAAYPFMDLVYFDLYERELGAVRIDAGSADAAAVARDIAVLEERLDQEEKRRFESRRSFGGQASPLPVGVVLAGLTTLQPEQPQLPKANACFALGTEKRCN